MSFGKIIGFLIIGGAIGFAFWVGIIYVAAKLLVK